MAKIDLKNAFRLCPVRLQDWHHLGIHWNGVYYVDKCLPLGLQSAPYVFNLLAEAIEWIAIHNNRVDQLIHYLDDFFTPGPPASQICYENMRKILALASCHLQPNLSLRVESSCRASLISASQLAPFTTMSP